MSHEFGWKTIPKADYDAMTEIVAECAIVQGEIDAALRFLNQKVWTVTDVGRVKAILQGIRDRWNSNSKPESAVPALRLVPPMPEFRS